MNDEIQTQHVYVKGVPCHEHKQQDINIAAEAVTRLGQWYPGHVWKVKVDSDRLGGVVYVQHMDLMAPKNRQYAYIVHLSTVYGDPNYLWALKAGGEILERANLARGRAVEGDIVTHIDGVRDKDQPTQGLII